MGSPGEEMVSFWEQHPRLIQTVMIQGDALEGAGWVVWEDDEGEPHTTLTSFVVALRALGWLLESDKRTGGSGIIETELPADEIG